MIAAKDWKLICIFAIQQDIYDIQLWRFSKLNFMFKLSLSNEKPNNARLFKYSGYHAILRSFANVFARNGAEISPWANSWTYIFMPQIRMGARVLIESKLRISISRWAIWVSSFSRASTSLETLVKCGLRSWKRSRWRWVKEREVKNLIVE